MMNGEWMKRRDYRKELYIRYFSYLADKMLFNYANDLLKRILDIVNNRAEIKIDISSYEEIYRNSVKRCIEEKVDEASSFDELCSNNRVYFCDYIIRILCILYLLDKSLQDIDKLRITGIDRGETDVKIKEITNKFPSEKGHLLFLYYYLVKLNRKLNELMRKHRDGDQCIEEAVNRINSLIESLGKDLNPPR